MMSVEDRLKAAAEHKASGDRANATALVESVLDMAPGHGGALSALAEIRFEEGNGDEAMQLLNDALARDRTDCAARNLLATVLMAQNRPDEARELVSETLELAPSDTRACVLRADLFVADNEHEQAEQLLRGALADNPGDASLLGALAGLYAAIRQNRAALQVAQEALAQDPGNPRLLSRLGCVLADLGDHEKAVPCLEAAHLKLPTDPVVMLFLAESQAAIGQVSEARALAKRLTLRFPGLLAGWLLLIRIDAQRGDTRKVFSEFLKQVKQHPDAQAALVSLAMAYRSLGYLSKPIRLLRPFLDDQATFKSRHRPQALTVLRDCMLASDNLGDLAKTLPGLDPAPAGGSPCGTGNDGLEISTGRDLLIDPALSSLDALVLLRFAVKPADGAKIGRVFGPAHMTPVAELLGVGTFEALDSQRGLQALAVADAPVPLTAVVKLPPDRLVRGRQTGPYVQPDAARTEKWRQALRDFPRPLIALAWNDSRPGLMLEDYRPVLAGLDPFGGTFLSVMWDKARHQLAAWPDIVDCGRHFETLADLSALLGEVDMLIGPDGLPTHIAGAMERPASVLTRPASPWYWHAHNGQSTWYPSVRVLKTKRFGHWTSLMEELSGPLQAAILDLGPEHRELASG